MGFQRDVLGADPATAWQLDVFGHDPQFPGMAADAGLTSSSWARGPHHQWGPMAGGRRPAPHAVLQRVRVDRAVGPRPAHPLHARALRRGLVRWTSSPTLAEAEAATYRAVRDAENRRADPQCAAAGRHRLHAAEQVGHRHPPRLECPLHLAEVRLRVALASSSPRCAPNSTTRGVAASPQTRDMNPIYTGKDVSYIDTKQANRAAENAVLDAERFAVFASLLRRRDVPAGRAGEGLGAAGLRRAPRRHHRLGVRPGLPRPADRLARRMGAGQSRRATTRWHCCPAWSTGRSWCGTRWRTIEPISSPRG